MNWNNTDTKPARFLPILVAGVLDEDCDPAVHEAFWDGDEWVSVRATDGGFDGTGNKMGISKVTHWAEMPELPTK